MRFDKARPRIGAFLYKNSNDLGSGFQVHPSVVFSPVTQPIAVPNGPIQSILSRCCKEGAKLETPILWRTFLVRNNETFASDL